MQTSKLQLDITRIYDCTSLHVYKSGRNWWGLLSRCFHTREYYGRCKYLVDTRSYLHPCKLLTLHAWTSPTCRRLPANTQQILWISACALQGSATVLVPHSL